MTRTGETFRDSEFLEIHNPSDEGNFIRNTVFVGMAFDLPSALSDTYQAIERACARLSLEAKRVDDEVGSGLIPNRILRGIELAEFLIFDLTVEKPNVYYELGYAHGVGNRASEILLVAKSGTKIHFDVAQLAILFYDSATDLERKLALQLPLMMTEARKAGLKQKRLKKALPRYSLTEDIDASSILKSGRQMRERNTDFIISDDDVRAARRLINAYHRQKTRK